jgi:hypothetical protein
LRPRIIENRIIDIATDQKKFGPLSRLVYLHRLLKPPASQHAYAKARFAQTALTDSLIT